MDRLLEDSGLNIIPVRSLGFLRNGYSSLVRVSPPLGLLWSPENVTAPTLHGDDITRSERNLDGLFNHFPTLMHPPLTPIGICLCSLSGRENAASVTGSDCHTFCDVTPPHDLSFRLATVLATLRPAHGTLKRQAL